MSINKLKKGLVGCLLGLSLVSCSCERNSSPGYSVAISSYSAQEGMQDSYNRIVSDKSLDDWLNEKIENAPIPFAPPHPLERWKVILACSLVYGGPSIAIALAIYLSEKGHRRRN